MVRCRGMCFLANVRPWTVRPAGESSPGSLFLSGHSESSMHLCKHWAWGHTHTLAAQWAQSLDWKDISHPKTIAECILKNTHTHWTITFACYLGWLTVLHSTLKVLLWSYALKNIWYKMSLPHNPTAENFSFFINSLQLFPERPMNSLVSAFHRYVFRSSIFWWSVLLGIGLRFHLSKLRSSCSRGWCSASSSCSSSSSWPCLSITLWGWWKEEEKKPSPHIF